MATQAALPRVVIENVSPQVEGGRYPLKRLVGDSIRLEADIYKDGHDQIAARVLFRPEGDKSWRESPLRYDFGPDRWHGRFDLDVVGRWEYVIEAWPDQFRTWRDALQKRIDAEQDVALELLEGASLLRKGMKRFGKAQKKVAQDAEKVLSDTSLSVQQRVPTAFSEELLQAVYGPLDPADATRGQLYEIIVDRQLAGVGAWYEFFPRSETRDPKRHGTFKDAAQRLPDIAAMGFDVVYLPPIHPIGRVNRKGRNNALRARPEDVGSPWAIGSDEGGHTAVHPDLGTIEDFDAFVAAATAAGLEVALDYALQCAPDHPWAKEHPEWFHICADGSIRYAENPPKKYEDIYPLNFWCADREGLWNACRDAVLFWIGHGVKIFRVDNPHTKPLAFWEWMIRDIQREHPDVVFLAEAFTRPKRMCGLAKIGFSQSYTYFTWKNTAQDLRELMGDLLGHPWVDVYRPNFFVNTPDILHEYLQHGGRPAFRIRLLLAGTLAPLYGIYSGYELCENTALRPGSEEYLDSEKYQIKVRDWDAPGNIRSDVAKLNKIRREHPALQKLDNLRFLPTYHERVLAYAKTARHDELIVVVNLDPYQAHECQVHVPSGDLGIGDQFQVEDLLSGERYTWHGGPNYVRLDPNHRVGHVFRIVR
jgi:starch synthase (maltosyl-transferring)